MIEEPPPVRIKGVGSSLWVTVAPDASVEFVQAELARLLAPLHPTGSTRVVLDTGNGQGGEERRSRIAAYLKTAFDLKEITAPQQINPREEKRFSMKDSRHIIARPGSDTLVIAGRVRSGQSVQAKKHLIVMGDVNPGCDLVAGGDILVLGSLCGTAAAGQPNNQGAVILALDFRPIQIKIGEIVAAGRPGSRQGTPEIAHIEEGAIMVDEYLGASPFKRIASPIIR